MGNERLKSRPFPLKTCGQSMVNATDLARIDSRYSGKAAVRRYVGGACIMQMVTQVDVDSGTNTNRTNDSWT